MQNENQVCSSQQIDELAASCKLLMEAIDRIDNLSIGLLQINIESQKTIVNALDYLHAQGIPWKAKTKYVVRTVRNK
jgi:hypothetical protein